MMSEGLKNECVVLESVCCGGCECDDDVVDDVM